MEDAIAARTPLHAGDWRDPVAFYINGYGDRILATPALRALAQLFEGRLRLVCARGDGETFYADLPLREVVEVDAHREERGWMFDVEPVVRVIGRCDLWLDLHAGGGPAVGALRKGLHPSAFVGLDGEHDVTLLQMRGRHVVDELFAVPRAFDASLRPEDFSAPPALPEADRREADEILGGVPAGMRILAVHTETLPSKTWTQEAFVRILDAFLARHEDFLALVVDRVCGTVDSGLRGSRVIPCSRLRLATAMALVARADLFLGVDSCMLHVADFARVPGIGLFSATDAKRFGYRFGEGEEIYPGTSMTEAKAEEIGRRLGELAGRASLLRGHGA